MASGKINRKHRLSCRYILREHANFSFVCSQTPNLALPLMRREKRIYAIKNTSYKVPTLAKKPVRTANL